MLLPLPPATGLKEPDEPVVIPPRATVPRFELPLKGCVAGCPELRIGPLVRLLVPMLLFALAPMEPLLIVVPEFAAAALLSGAAEPLED